MTESVRRQTQSTVCGAPITSHVSVLRSPMFVDVRCKKCGNRKRLDVGTPAAGQALEEHLRLLMDRLSHQPSFGCFGGHFELAPPLPGFWDIQWDTLGES